MSMLDVGGLRAHVSVLVAQLTFMSLLLLSRQMQRNYKEITKSAAKLEDMRNLEEQPAARYN